MKLDERFKVLPFCCFGADKKAITNHIGKKGYFANTIRSFNNIKLCKYGTLGTVLGDQQESFYMNETEETFSFFIPEFFVKPKEKKYRPYKIMQEFPWLAGDVLKYRSKSEPSVHILTSIQSIATKDGSLVYVYMDGFRFTPLHLFTDYEYLNIKGDEWLPFGVEVEDK